MAHQEFRYKELLTSGKLNKLADDISSNTGHDHSQDTGGTGKKLDWDTCWADSVHDHSSDAEGGGLNWNTCWSDPLHNHQSNNEGGKINTNGIADGAATSSVVGVSNITKPKIGDGEIGYSKLYKDSFTVTHTSPSMTNREFFTLFPLFYPQLKTESGAVARAQIASYLSSAIQRHNVALENDGGSGTVYARCYGMIQ